MSVTGTVVAGNFPYGNPGSRGEPLGLWVGSATLTGDATGGFAGLTFTPQTPTVTPALADQRREYMYFLDDVRITCDVDPGNMSLRVFNHMARSNKTLGVPFTHTRVSDALDDSTVFAPSSDLMTDRLTRMPIFWDTEELADVNDGLVQLIAENNVNLANYRFEAYGRYYQRGVIGSRSFGRLVSPPAVSQFEG